MIISTPKIGDLSDDNTLTMSNTLANALITADFSYSPPQKHHIKTPSISTNSTTTTNTTNTTSNSNENGPQPRTPASKPSRRASTTGYVSRVGFDTLGCDATSEYAFTLQSKTDGWSRSKHSRTFLVGTDSNDYSAHALHWVMENMVENGDEVRLFLIFTRCHQIPITTRDCVRLEPYHWWEESRGRSHSSQVHFFIFKKKDARLLFTQTLFLFPHFSVDRMCEMDTHVENGEVEK
jgi:hypothetical protein